jgi:hypothetical protein
VLKFGKIPEEVFPDGVADSGRSAGRKKIYTLKLGAHWIAIQFNIRY